MKSATGIEVLGLGEKHLGEKYVLGVLAPKDKAHWRGPWDCAEYASWCVYQAAGILYGCYDNRGNPATADAYTGYWGRDAEKLGRKISPAEAAGIPGALVLRLGTKVGHIVISDGKGGTVEAHSTARGVIRDTLSGRRWTMGILVPGISYGAMDTIALATPAVYRLTSPPMRGEEIRRLQVALRREGYVPGAIDGIFGSQTYLAVMQFQQANGLAVDGEVGPRTAHALWG